jgi:hypothetical protein
MGHKGEGPRGHRYKCSSIVRRSRHKDPHDDSHTERVMAGKLGRRTTQPRAMDRPSGGAPSGPAW